MTVMCYNQVAEGEARASVLQREVERLSLALLKVQEDESSLKEKTSSLRKSLQEATASHSSAEGRLAGLHKTLSEAERARRALQVSLRVVAVALKCCRASVTVAPCPCRDRRTRLGRQPPRPGGWRRPSASAWRACRVT